MLNMCDVWVSTFWCSKTVRILPSPLLAVQSNNPPKSQCTENILLCNDHVFEHAWAHINALEMLAVIDVYNCYIINDVHVTLSAVFLVNIYHYWNWLIAPFLLYYFLSSTAVAIFSCALSIMLIYFFSPSLYIIHWRCLIIALLYIGRRYSVMRCCYHCYLTLIVSVLLQEVIT